MNQTVCVRCETPLTDGEREWLFLTPIGTDGREGFAFCHRCWDDVARATRGAPGVAGPAGIAVYVRKENET